MQKAVFLDRDGVINNGDLYYTFKKEDFHFNPDVFEALKLLKSNDFLLIVITNQGGISKGKYTHQQVEELHQFMEESLKKQGVELTEVYYCSHHHTLEHCICRKPDSGMLEKAIARFHIDVSKSFLIGDGERDIEAGQKVGLKTFRTKKNESILDYCKTIIASR